jgi:N-methylhydantoinase A
MEKAIRVISVERGHDPRDFTLVAFGGGGPLHACALARALRIPRVLVPDMPGALSAVGILLADVVRDYSRTVMLPGDAIENLTQEFGETKSFAELEQQGAEEFAAKGLRGVPQRTLDLRYRHQGYELNVDFDPLAPAKSIEAFHALHLQRYGFSDAERPVEIVNLRLRMIAAGDHFVPRRSELGTGDGRAAFYVERGVFLDGRFRPTRFYHREKLAPGDRISGPAMITEYTAATLLPPGSSAQVDGFGNLVIAVEDGVRA